MPGGNISRHISVACFCESVCKNGLACYCRAMLSCRAVISAAVRLLCWLRHYNASLYWSASGNHNSCHRRPCLKKCPKLFLSELRQISTNFDNFWHKEDKVMRVALISISPNSRQHTNTNTLQWRTD